MGSSLPWEDPRNLYSVTLSVKQKCKLSKMLGSPDPSRSGGDGVPTSSDAW